MYHSRNDEDVFYYPTQASPPPYLVKQSQCTMFDRQQLRGIVNPVVATLVALWHADGDAIADDDDYNDYDF